MTGRESPITASEDSRWRDHEFRRFRSDHSGNPLGRGFPLGSPLRLDGESHLDAWMRIARNDPCAYCGRGGCAPFAQAGTADHIEPRDPLVRTRGIGGVHCWLNVAGACASCNTSKRNRPLLRFLWIRS